MIHFSIRGAYLITQIEMAVLEHFFFFEKQLNAQNKALIVI